MKLNLYEIAAAEHGSETYDRMLAEGWEPFAVTMQPDTERTYVDDLGGVRFVSVLTNTFTDYVWFRRVRA